MRSQRQHSLRPKNPIRSKLPSNEKRSHIPKLVPIQRKHNDAVLNCNNSTNSHSLSRLSGLVLPRHILPQPSIPPANVRMAVQV